jgi:peptidyl-prolyl cis-trans isomerase A (cyclophilin A)
MGLLDPKSATAVAPDRFTVALDTTKGTITIDVDRSLAPRGADRFYNLISLGYYDGSAFFRVVEGFVAQAGIHPDPAIGKVWRDARIPDDPVRTSNVAGTVTFATSGKDARTTQFFISLRNNGRLDAMGFAPFGTVRDLAPVKALYAGYGEGAPNGKGPQQGRVHREGRAYLEADFPLLDLIRAARTIR